MRFTMRCSVALGALLISATTPALSQDAQQAEMLHDEEAAQVELRQEEAPMVETGQDEPQRDEMQQSELQRDEPQADEMQPAEVRQGALEPQEMQQEDLPQDEIPPVEMREDRPVRGELPRAIEWRVFVEPGFGTRIDIPRNVFVTPDGPAFRGVGRQFKTPDGRAVLAVYSQSNKGRDTPASYLKKTFRASRAALAYKRVAHDFFAVAGLLDGAIYYSRCNFSHRAGGTLHCFDVKYPLREKLAWDGIVTRMSLSLKPR